MTDADITTTTTDRQARRLDMVEALVGTAPRVLGLACGTGSITAGDDGYGASVRSPRSTGVLVRGLPVAPGRAHLARSRRAASISGLRPGGPPGFGPRTGCVSPPRGWKPRCSA
ncbi:hypothetical protein QFZ43_002858 [Streptomyces afghaniensis]|nr:hypothetical protein [Streptomyces afghaniensis]